MEHSRKYQPGGNFLPGDVSPSGHWYRMVYVIIVKKSPTWHITRTIKAKRLILKSELRRVAANFYKVAELDVTVI